MTFLSPTYGRLEFEQVVDKLLAYMHADATAKYKLMVGCDSQNGRDKTLYVTVIVLHRVGKGGIFFYTREMRPRERALAPRIFNEASRSLDLACALAEALHDTPLADELEVHLDVGLNGPTRALVKETVGMITGSGFEAKIKPDSLAASHTADLFTKSISQTHKNRILRRERRYAKGKKG